MRFMGDLFRGSTCYTRLGRKENRLGVSQCKADIARDCWIVPGKMIFGFRSTKSGRDGIRGTATCGEGSLLSPGAEHDPLTAADGDALLVHLYLQPVGLAVAIVSSGLHTEQVVRRRLSQHAIERD